MPVLTVGTDERKCKSVTSERLARITLGPPPTPLNGPVRLVDFDPSWPLLFEKEKKRIGSALGDKAIMIEHVGSTSVPGLAAKPNIDILLVVENSADEKSYIPALESVGYILRIREPEWHEHRMFRGPDTSVNVHVFSRSDVEIERMLGFRDWLRTHPDDRDLYERTKKELAGRTWEYTQDYADAKSKIVESIIKRAKASKRVRHQLAPGFAQRGRDITRA
jgi:GrpB-like predicted nucleotidyltransferase (UPF0157 family)